MWPNEITEDPPSTDGEQCAPCSCDPCGGSAGLNAPLAPTQSTTCGCNGTSTTEVRARASNSSGYSSDWTRSGCVRLRLKSGSILPLTWNRMGAAGAIESAYQSGWCPAGAGAVFSFLPRVNAYETPARRRYSEDGSVFFDATGLAGSWIPDTAVLGTTYFTTAEPLAGTYFEYWAGTNFDPVPPSPPPASDPLFGALNRRIDRNGNELRYTYSAASGGPTTILRKITGDIGGTVVPYFEYADETGEAPVTKIYLCDLASPQNSRTIYFEYIRYGFNNGISNFTAPYLSKIVSPGGCVRQYDPRVPLPVYGITEIKREVDPEGYETYFEYAGTIMTKSVEPEGRITYYSYDTTAQTSFALLGRPKSYMIYGTASGGGEMPVVLWETDPLGNTTYFDYNLTAIRAKTKIEPNGNVTYFEHFNAYPSPVALTRRVSGFNGASTYFGYSPLYYDVVKTVGPRHTSSFPVVTYYSYDTRRNRISSVNSLGGASLFGRDSLGRIFRTRDVLGNATYYNFDSATGGMISQVDALGNAGYFGYDSFLNRAREVSPRWTERNSFAPFTSYHEYDALDRVIKAIDPQNNVTYYEWTSRGDVMATVDPSGTTTAFVFNGLRLGTEGSVTDASGTVLRQEKHGYDIYKNRVRTLDPRGNVSYFVYDALDRLVARLDPLRNVTYFGYDSVSNLKAQTNERGFTTNHFFDALSRKTCSRDPLGGLTYFGYDLSDNLARILDARRNATYYFYDQLDRQSAVRDAQGNATYYFYDAGGNATVVMDARFSSTYYAYDGLNRVARRRDALGGATYFGYDAASNRTRILNPLRNPTYFFYDTLDRLQAAVDAAGSATYFGYDRVGNKTRTLDSLGNTVYFIFDGLCRPAVGINALGNTSYFGYDAAGNLIKSKDARGYTSYFVFDALNRAQASVNPAGNGFYRIFDPAGNIIAERQTFGDPAAYGEQSYGDTPYGGSAGATFAYIYFAYDAHDRMTLVQNQVGATTYFECDPVGNRSAVVDARGNTTLFAYDALNRVSAFRDPLGNSSYYFYDAAHNRTVVRNPLLHSTYFGYDALNREVRIQNAAGGKTYFEYDAVGNITRILDPNLRAVMSRYDVLSRRDAVRKADGASTYYFYDRLSNLTKEVNPLGNAAYFAYDALKRVIRNQDARGNTIYFEYDPVGNLARFVDGEAGDISQVYDGANRRTLTTYTPAGSIVAASLKADPSFAYGPTGDLTEMTDLWGTHVMEYDSCRRQVRHLFPNSRVVYYEYDAASNLATQVYPGSSGKAKAEYDGLNRQSKIQAPSGATAYFTYDAASNLSQRRYGNNMRLVVNYDNAERVSTWRNATSPGAMLSYFDYTRDAKGLITKCVREATHTVYHVYDTNDRLTAETWLISGNKPTEVYGYRYAYDAAGNRTTARINGANTYYSYDRANQLIVSGTTSAFANPTYYIYDKNGALTNLVEPSGATYFAYNTAGLVARIRWKDTTSTYFFYDGNLQRYAAVISGSATYFLWDGPNLLQELNADGTVKEEHTNARTSAPGIAQLVETNRPGQAQPKLYPVMDPRGTISKWLQADGTTVFASREYDGFGQVIPGSASGTWPGRFGYQGQSWQEILSGNGSQRLLLSPTRLYDPAIGRFLQQDPDLSRRSATHYLYANSAPAQFVDPQGGQSEGQIQNMMDGPKVPKIFDTDYTSPTFTPLDPPVPKNFTMADVPLKPVELPPPGPLIQPPIHIEHPTAVENMTNAMQKEANKQWQKHLEAQDNLDSFGNPSILGPDSTNTYKDLLKKANNYEDAVAAVGKAGAKELLDFVLDAFSAGEYLDEYCPAKVVRDPIKQDPESGKGGYNPPQQKPKNKWDYGLSGDLGLELGRTQVIDKKDFMGTGYPFSITAKGSVTAEEFTFGSQYLTTKDPKDIIPDATRAIKHAVDDGAYSFKLQGSLNLGPFYVEGDYARKYDVEHHNTHHSWNAMFGYSKPF